MDELILRTVVIQFDGRVVEMFGLSETLRMHVAQMTEPTIGKPDSRGRCEVVLSHHFRVDADEIAKLRPLLGKITDAIRVAQSDLPPRKRPPSGAYRA